MHLLLRSDRPSRASSARREPTTSAAAVAVRAAAPSRQWFYRPDHRSNADERYVFVDDGISGAEFEKRPGLQSLLASLEPVPPFQALIVTEQSRLGRETLDTLIVVRQIERASVGLWACNDGRRISLTDARASGGRRSAGAKRRLQGARGQLRRRRNGVRVPKRAAPRSREAARPPRDRRATGGGDPADLRRSSIAR